MSKAARSLSSDLVIQTKMCWTGVQSYFQYYAKLANQQNMLQDGVRTSTYNRAIAGKLRDV